MRRLCDLCGLCVVLTWAAGTCGGCVAWVPLVLTVPPPCWWCVPVPPLVAWPVNGAALVRTVTMCRRAGTGAVRPV